MESTNNRVPKRASLLNEFLWICAGVNRKILLQCPTDWAKYAGQGGLILFTALMAMLSGGYAFYYIFESLRWAVIFGIFWGLLIFNLDRFIVNTMYSDGKYTISWGEIGAGMPRIIIAIFIGIVISTPLELKIFEDEINVKIKEIKQAKARNYVEDDTRKSEDLEAKLEKIRSKPLEDVIATSTALKNSTIYQEMIQLRALINTKNQEKLNFEKERRKYDPSVDSAKYYRVSKKIGILLAEINKLNGQYNSLNSQLAAGDEEYKRLIEEAQRKKDEEIQRILAQINEIRVKIASETQGYSAVLDEEFGGLKTRMSTFNTMKKEDRTTWWVSLFVTLLFIIIEICPTFFKMMIASGPYDCLLDAERHAKKVSSMKMISDLNDKINTEILISTGKNRNRIDVEIANNKALIQHVASIQSEILSIAIEKWREEELQKVAENPSQYIKTETYQQGHNRL